VEGGYSRLNWHADEHIARYHRAKQLQTNTTASGAS
jgi:hypothetical protein